MVTFKEAARRVFGDSRGPIDASHARGWPKQESDVGHVEVGYRLQKQRVPHPQNMGSYDEWANDPEAAPAFNVLTDIIAGVSYYTEMPELDEKGSKIPEDHKHKRIIDDYGEDINLDEKMSEITMTYLQKGFCPVERLEGYDLKLLPPESFYIHQDKKGNLIKYTQERAIGDVIAEWKTKKEMENIIMFFHRRTTGWPYGKSLTEPIGDLMTDRGKMNKDMAAAIHRWGYPIPIMETSRNKATLQKACEDREADEWIFIGDVNKDEVRFNTVQIDPQARFVPYIELINYQIGECLHAPLMLQMKNSTEASANVMMDSVDRLVGGCQRYNKRRMERFLFKPQVGKPVPRVVWGQPKTGLEDVTLESIALILPHITRNQREDLLKQFGIALPAAEKDPLTPDAPLPGQQQPFQKHKTGMPVEAIISKIADMRQSLNIIHTNFKEHKIKLREAMRYGERVINIHLKLAHGDGTPLFREKREEAFRLWVKRLLGVKEGGGKTYEVRVPDS